VQQVIMLATSEGDVVLVAHSDVEFVRPFTVET
jgi:hypothetical protein